MDLIAELINSKKQKNQFDLKPALEELITYQKLSKIPQLVEINKLKNSTRMPIIAKALNGDPYSFWLINTAINIAGEIDRTIISLQTRFKNSFSKRKYEQLLIIGNTRKIYTQYKSLSTFSLTNNHNNLLVLSQKNDNINATIICIIDVIESNVYIYTGKINNEDLNKEVPNNVIKPLTVDGVTIKILSNQGNNDFEFAHTQDYAISMPKQKTLNYRNLTTDKITTVYLSDDDLQTLMMKPDAKTYCQIIAKNLPRKET